MGYAASRFILLSGWPYRDPSRLSVKLASRRGVPAFRLLGTIAWSVLFTFEPRAGRTFSRLTTGSASVALNPTKVCGGGVLTDSAAVLPSWSEQRFQDHEEY